MLTTEGIKNQVKVEGSWVTLKKKVPGKYGNRRCHGDGGGWWGARRLCQKVFIIKSLQLHQSRRLLMYGLDKRIP